MLPLLLAAATAVILFTQGPPLMPDLPYTPSFPLGGYNGEHVPTGRPVLDLSTPGSPIARISFTTNKDEDECEAVVVDYFPNMDAGQRLRSLPLDEYDSVKAGEVQYDEITLPTPLGISATTQWWTSVVADHYTVAVICGNEATPNDADVSNFYTVKLPKQS